MDITSKLDGKTDNMWVARIVGAVLLIVGICGFIPAFTAAPYVEDPVLRIDEFYSRVFAIFPNNVLSNILWIAFGLWGLSAARRSDTAVGYDRSLAIVFLVLAIMGMIPGLNTVFGLMPLFGNNVWLFALLAIVMGYFGYRSASHVTVERRNTTGPGTGFTRPGAV